MRLFQGELLHSASDLSNFLSCEHLEALNLRALLDPEHSPAPCADSEDVELIQNHGFAHEARYLELLRRSGRQVTELKDLGCLRESVQATEEAMRRGDDVIYKAALMSAPFSGYADFLLRVPGASLLGDWHYEVADTKLARSPKAKFLVQLCFYADLIARIQGVPPAYVHLCFGDGTERSYRTADFRAYFENLRERYLEFIDRCRAGVGSETYPDPVSHCGFCGWREVCGQRLLEDDHLSQVAGISKGQIQKLNRAGVATLEALGRLDSRQTIPKLHSETLARLRQQARLQLEKRIDKKNRLELLPVEPARGFSRLPQPDPGDLFFDMEGDPYQDGGLEYLFGVGEVVAGTFCFHDFWAHDRKGERLAFEAFVDFVVDHLGRHPGAHIYHYAAYEETALKRLMSMHGTREAEVDALLRQGKLVDLYKVVREGIRVSEPSYSIKNLETFYADKRSGEVKNAGASIVWYEKWRETREQKLLDDIRSYNEDDCRSTWQLLEWLLSLRPAEAQWASAGAPATLEEARKPWETRLEGYRAALLGALPEDPSTWNAEGRMREVAFQLLDFHRRENKPAWWALFARAEASEEALLEDMECLAGLTLDPERPPVADKRSYIWTYRYPEQETKLRSGYAVRDVESGREFIDFAMLPDEHRVQLRVGAKWVAPPRLNLGPCGPIDSKPMQEALVRLADSLVAGDHRYRAVEALLRRDLPRLRSRAAGTPLLPGIAGLLPEVIDAAGDLNESYLFIQGPPGSGKTWTGSRIIVEMLKRGKRIAVASNSHKAIHNLLASVEKVAEETGFAFRGAKKSNGDDPDSQFRGKFVRDVFSPGEVQAEDQLVAGTAWLFARADFDQAFDQIFVDEAGQVALANLAAMGTCARNLVLLGDPMQLGQPTQGTHPGHSGESGLEYLLEGRATVPTERGVFLPTTYRMAPALCRFISDAVYDGRLEAESNNANQKLALGATADPALAEAGIRFVPVDHQGNAQQSAEEAGRVACLIESLLKQDFVDRDGVRRRITLEDILVVAPYNLQVHLLRQTLPSGARVGTVDKFQGQEAAVAIVSMATSSQEDLSRNIGFLFSKNRLNVAISRARCLALVVASPKLLTVHCATVEQMALVNLLCWIAREKINHH